ncbi:MAG TPA: endonuclease/exonuclease/phosphatase family protein [Pyrinomonadaceae bacterium]|nr:endonuclease/exonuclease/phosphatase family protein [Pyrinomonadaceae bacterium]
MMTAGERAHVFETPPDGVEVGDFSAPGGVAGAPRATLVVASFNIRYAVGSFLITGSLGRRVGLTWPKRRPRLVARHLGRAALALADGRRLPPPDIVALQEADKLTARAGGHDIARELAQELRMLYARAASSAPRGEGPKSKQWYLDFEEHIARADAGDTGLAFLSRAPFRSVWRVELPWDECAWRPRLALGATVECGGRPLHLFNSHIDPHASVEGQLKQHAAVLEMAQKLSGPVVLLGDFNTLSKRSCLATRRLLEAHGFASPFPTGTATWRAGLVRLHTDWIFVRGARVKSYGVARPLGVSDHWPVWAEIEPGGGEGL